MQKVRYNKNALTACGLQISVTISITLFLHTFSSFIHTTSSLSIVNTYLGLANGSAIFKYRLTFGILLQTKFPFIKYGTITLFGKKNQDFLKHQEIR